MVGRAAQSTDLLVPGIYIHCCPEQRKCPGRLFVTQGAVHPFLASSPLLMAVRVRVWISSTVRDYSNE
jgi:hypothetical protein